MRDIPDVRRQISKELEPYQLQLDEIRDRLDNLQTRVTSDPGSFAEIVNMLDNSHPEWSTDAYTTLYIEPDTAGDGNLECYGWYRQEAADTILTKGTLTALKAPMTIEPAEHTQWAANEDIDDDIPRWDKVNGTIEIGGASVDWDIFFPIPGDFIYPGQRFYIQFEAMLASGALPDGLQAYAGIWDSTVGQEKWIEGGNFTITDDQGNDPGVPFGTPGSTSVDYKVVAFTDTGETAISNTLNFPNAPDVFDGNNHPRIKFAGIPGFIRFEIYRKIGSVYVKQYTVGNTIEGTYFDIGNPPQSVVSGWPVITGTTAKAYAKTKRFSPGTLTGLGWVKHTLTIMIPTTYDRSLTEAEKQSFRFGLTGNTDVARQILVRRLALSMGSGKWARSTNDTRTGAHSRVSSTATGAGEGAGTGGGYGPPPPPGGGGEDPGCVLLDSIMKMAGGEKVLSDVVSGDFSDSSGSVSGRVMYVKQAHTARVFEVTTESGLKVFCTFDHPFITSPTDYNGTSCIVLKKRMEAGRTVSVLVKPENEVFTDNIVSIEEHFGDFFVGMPIMDGPHIVILNGFLSHNAKEGGGDPGAY